MKKYLLPIILVILIVVIAIYFATKSNPNEDVVSDETTSEMSSGVNDLLENCEEITSDDYERLIKECRSSEEKEMNLPFNLKFGMTKEQYIDCIKNVLEKSGLPVNNAPSVENGLLFDFKLPQLTIHLDPVFTEKNGLYQLVLSIKQDLTSNSVEDPVRQLVDFYFDKNSNYKSFKRYTIGHKLFFATKDNQFVLPERSKGFLYFLNVPQVPEEFFDKVYGKE